MTGTLGLFSLVDLFQLLAASTRSGRLSVVHPEGDARIFFDKGRVVHADFGGEVGEAAIYALFADERGSFEFQLGQDAPQVSVTISTENLLFEATRRLDETRRSDTQRVPPDAVPVRVEAGAQAANLPAQEAAVFKLIDGRLDVGELAERAGLSALEAGRIVARLKAAGRVTVRGAKPRTARLVTQLSRERLSAGVVGLDANIYASWERALGHAPTQVACRRANGHVDVLRVQAVTGAGPYLLISQATLFGSSLAVNMTLLVKPLEDA